MVGGDDECGRGILIFWVRAVRGAGGIGGAPAVARPKNFRGRGGWTWCDEEASESDAELEGVNGGEGGKDGAVLIFT